MNITVYDNFKKAVNSTKRPTGGRSISVRLKDNCSVVNPVFRLKSNDKNINYVKWDNNYYNVDNVEFLANEEIAIHCSRDAMATFKDDIGGSTQYITRSATAFNGLICDDKYPTYNIANTQTGMAGQLQQQISDVGTVVIGIINKNANRGVEYYAFSPASSDFRGIMNYMFSDAWLDSSASEISTEIQKELVNPMQYIVSSMWFPIAIGNIRTYSDPSLTFGWWDSEISAPIVAERIYDGIGGVINLPRHPQADTNGLYMNGAPYTRYDFKCWNFGNIPIDSLPFVSNNKMHVRILVDLFTGMGEINISDDRGAIIVKQASQFGIPFQLSQINQNLMSGISSVVAGVTSSVTSFGAGNVVGGVLGLANGITSGISNAMPQVKTSGATGSKVQFYLTPEVTCQYYYQVSHDVADFGRPLMDTRTISTLSGYIECEHVHLNTSATQTEKEAIIGMMQSGFFYE